MGVIYHFTVLCKAISVFEHVNKTYLICHLLNVNYVFEYKYQQLF